MGIAMPTLTVVLTEHHAAVVEDLIACGRYQNASEVLCEGLRLLEKREADELEAEHAGLVMLSEAEIGLRQYIASQRVTPAELDSLLLDDGFGDRPRR